MRIKMISLFAVLFVGSAVTSVSLAEAPSGTQHLVRDTMGQVTGKGHAWQSGQALSNVPTASTFSAMTNAAANKSAESTPATHTAGESVAVVPIAPLVARVSQMPEFADWQQARAVMVRTLYDPSGHANALLWQIVSRRKGQSLGYLVSTTDARQAYEFSHRPVPTVPARLQAKVPDNGFLYAGPMLHLVYVQGLDGMELYNLLTGETLPSGEVQNRVPILPPPVSKAQPNLQVSEHLLPISASPEDDAFYATGLFGKYKLDQYKGILPLADYARADAFTQPSFVVYDVIPDKWTVPLAMTKVIKQGQAHYVGVQNPFATTEDRKTPVYIDSRFLVFVVPIGKSPNTPSAT